MLGAAGDLLSGPDPIRHAVNFYERGTQPLEIVTTRQWYIRNGAHDEKLRAALLARGGQIDWHPPHMQVRYENWVGGLAGDWLISRSGSSACRSRCGIRWTTRAGPGTTRRSSRTTPRCRWTRRPMPRRATHPGSAASRAGSPGIRT